ncbi:AcrR family transcriptional regulator [Rhodoligotrophos appendicifer]|uniref:TetR family transcriptional regulator C-terminal domain-containing protein n=1 Tax=Rhodoligotrophos appendicifer TaxID=987056 RepID=UPI0011870EC4|nr:TetR family transcriptional regulator C-terminal domain-containing protein [Rhodoligotrophos appendicifer]
MTRGKFERKLPEDRRRSLIAATLKCLAEEGHAGLSVRKISSRAGISVGLINHHYPSKEALIAQAYETLASALLEAVREVVAEAGQDPRGRVTAFFRASFAKPALDHGVLRCWIVFWGMIDESPLLAQIHDRTYGDYRAFIEQLLQALAVDWAASAFDVRLAAIGLSALLDGLWLEWCLNPRTFSTEEAVILCENWVDSLSQRRS